MFVDKPCGNGLTMGIPLPKSVSSSVDVNLFMNVVHFSFQVLSFSGKTKLGW
jgi:hypothetical protein